MRWFAGIPILASVIWAAGTTAQVKASGAEESKARAEIAALLGQYAAAIKGADAAAVAALFTPTGIHVYNGDQRGRAEIQAAWLGWLKTWTWQEAAMTTEELDVYGDAAYNFGVWQGRFTTNVTGATNTQRMRFFAVIKRQPDGAWKFDRLILSNAPLRNR